MEIVEYAVEKILDGRMVTGGGTNLAGYAFTTTTPVRLVRKRTTDGQVVALLVKCDQGFMEVMRELKRLGLKYEIGRQCTTFGHGIGHFQLCFKIGYPSRKGGAEILFEDVAKRIEA